MRILVQRSKNSKVLVNNHVVGEIDFGFVIFIGFSIVDTKENVDKLIKKLLNLRVFDDANGVMNKSILDIGGSILSISQFTLYADTKKGNRPSYVMSMKYDDANNLYNYFNDELKKYINTSTGIFGSEMEVNIINDGPITIMLEG